MDTLQGGESGESHPPAGNIIVSLRAPMERMLLIKINGFRD